MLKEFSQAFPTYIPFTDPFRGVSTTVDPTVRNHGSDMVLLRIPGAPSLVAEITQILQQTLPLLWSLGSAARALQQFGACGVKEFTSNRFQSQIIKLYKIQVLQTGFRLHRLGCNSQK